MPVSLREVSGISIAEKSIAPVLLPIAVDSIYHNEHYRTGAKRRGLMRAPTPEFGLHAAAREGRYDEIRDLLRRGGLDANQEDHNGDTALVIAIRNLHTRTVEVLQLFGAEVRPGEVVQYVIFAYNQVYMCQVRYGLTPLDSLSLLFNKKP